MDKNKTPEAKKTKQVFDMPIRVGKDHPEMKQRYQFFQVYVTRKTYANFVRLKTAKKGDIITYRNHSTLDGDRQAVVTRLNPLIIADKGSL